MVQLCIEDSVLWARKFENQSFALDSNSHWAGAADRIQDQLIICWTQCCKIKDLTLDITKLLQKNNRAIIFVVLVHHKHTDVCHVVSREKKIKFNVIEIPS